MLLHLENHLVVTVEPGSSNFRGAYGLIIKGIDFLFPTHSLTSAEANTEFNYECKTGSDVPVRKRDDPLGRQICL